MIKNKTKKWMVSAVLLNVFAMQLIVGCSSKADTKPTVVSDSSAKVSDKKWSGTLKVQLIGDFSMEDKTNPLSGKKVKGVSVLKKEFERLYPGATLEFILLGWDGYVQKTDAMLNSKGADVFQVPGIANLASQDLLEPLAPYIEKDKFDLGIFIDNQVEGWKAMGPKDKDLQIYGLPFIGDTRVIAYDKKIFKEWGVEELSKNPTPEEILEKAKKMTGINPKTGKQNYGAFYAGADAADSVMNAAEAYGGSWGKGFLFKGMEVNFNSPEMLKGLKWMNELNTLAPKGALVKQGGEKWGTANNDIAIHIRVQPIFVDQIYAAGLQDQYGVAPLFINKEKKMGGMFAGSPYSIAKSSANKELSWEFLKFSVSDFFQKYMWEEQSSQFLPVIKSAAKFESLQKNPHAVIELESMGKLWAPRYPYRSGQPRYILSESVEEGMLGKSSLEAALEKAQKESTAWLAAQK
ncbi:extracellular solute-binding protein [Paenibacillus radicis (ex Xue et al. 2023)]|uniref:Extracellular solute-binding protein n=1 Tax=Paenibacillus radicis (ex Xue et al. 2023) TaxID=2972489 RepID=A0ABT1YTB9_9BACL|nr:extracellular solute-binding protein [Paenibacillus radicis (ex Xue et al. 2023)]MCR8636252.1 extracellular solute-binding protein [Paenibacillus radicis (ex Xue et al. 2023)]